MFFSLCTIIILALGHRASCCLPWITHRRKNRKLQTGNADDTRRVDITIILRTKYHTSKLRSTVIRLASIYFVHSSGRLSPFAVLLCCCRERGGYPTPKRIKCSSYITVLCGCQKIDRRSRAPREDIQHPSFCGVVFFRPSTEC